MRVIVAVCFCAVSVFGQYGGGGGNGGGSGAGTTPTSGGYGGYSAGTGIAIGAAAAAGVLVAYLIVHNHHKNGKVVGCLGGSPATPTLDAKNGTFTVVNDGSVPLKTGERVALTGKVTGSSFAVQGVAKDYGPCTH
jgi:hypothetical protein